MIRIAVLVRTFASTAALLVLSTTGAFAYCDDVSDAGAQLDQAALDEINALRQNGTVCRGVSMPPAPPLSMDPRLQCAARNHSQDMASQSFFDHTNAFEPDEATAQDRVAKAGYPNLVAENIAAGSPTPSDVVRLNWGQSDHGHCEGQVNPEHEVVGIGYAQSADGTAYWTAVYGKR